MTSASFVEAKNNNGCILLILEQLYSRSRSKFCPTLIKKNIESVKTLLKNSKNCYVLNN